MDKTEIIAPEPTKKSGIAEKILSVVMVFLVAVVVLWNWDGFWQTKIPALVAVQKTYLPVKYDEEQRKISGKVNSAGDLAAAKAEIVKLESEIKELKKKIANNNK